MNSIAPKIPPTNEPTMPSNIVGKMPIDCSPGTNSRPIAPTTNPNTAQLITIQRISTSTNPA